MAEGAAVHLDTRNVIQRVACERGFVFAQSVDLALLKEAYLLED